MVCEGYTVTRVRVALGGPDVLGVITSADMTDNSSVRHPRDGAEGSWLERHPAIVPVLASIAFLQIFQGLFMALKFGSLGPATAVGLASVGVFVAPVTLLLLLPIILLLRRWHPAWRDGDRQRASWAVGFGLTSGLAGWMIADQAVSRDPPPRFSGGNLYDLPAVLVEDGSWRFILRANGQQELYDVEFDPQERNNVALQNPQVAERLRHLLEPRLAALLEDAEGEEAEFSAETLEALRSLGYVN